MSGGSFNYLADAGDCEGWVPRKSTIDRMADYLEEQGHHQAARETRDVIALFDAAERACDELRDVWHAAEWRCSGDWGSDQLAAAVYKHAGHDCATLGFHPYDCVDSDWAYRAGGIKGKWCDLCDALVEQDESYRPPRRHPPRLVPGDSFRNRWSNRR